MFARNKEALAQLGYEAGASWEYLTSSQVLHRWSSGEEKWPASTKSIGQVHRFYQESGWSDMIVSQSNNSLVPISLYSNSLMLPSPAFYQGKQYQIIAGDHASPNSWKLYRLTHPSIPIVIPIIQEGRIHNLVEYKGDMLLLLEIMHRHGTGNDIARQNLGGGYEFVTEDVGPAVPARSLLLLAQRVLSTMYFIHKQGFVLGMNENYDYPIYVSGWPHDPQVTILAGYMTSRCPIGHPDQDADDESDCAMAYYLLSNIHISTDTPEDEKAGTILGEFFAGNESLISRIETLLGKPKVPYVYPQEYKLPECTPADVESFKTTFGNNEPTNSFENHSQDYELEPWTIMWEIDLFMAARAKGLNPQSLQPVAEIRAGLASLGYVRTPLDLYMLVDGEDYVQEIKDSAGQSLLHYQNDYDAHTTGSVDIVNGAEVEEYSLRDDADFWQKAVPIVTPWMEWRPFIRDPHESSSYWRHEWLRESVPIVSETLNLHGIEMDSSALARLFYNTPLALAVEYGTKEYDPVYMASEDVLLLQDFLEGRIMPFVLYSQLSKTAFAPLSPMGSFLDLYAYLPARGIIDRAFRLGEPYMEPVAELDRITV